MNKHFLLVDDDFDDADLFSVALKQADSSVGVSHVSDGGKLFDFLNTQQIKPDIIFLDINLPGLSGWECLHQLKNNNEYKELPVIMYSTMYDLEDHEMARRMQAVGLLTKPNSLKALVEMLTVITKSTRHDMKEVMKSFLK